MKSLTFTGGVHPEYCKEISISEPLREGLLPTAVAIPLSQHIGAPCEAIVKKGDEVEEGQMIAKSDSFVSSPIHSSISGKVTDIKKIFHPALGPAKAIYIERNAEKEPRKYSESDVESLTKEDFVEKIKNAGIVGMGGAAFPTHVKLKVPEGKKIIRTLIINGAECEPYLTCDHMIMTRKTQEVLRGIAIVMEILEPEEVYIAIEDNKKAAFFAFQKAIKKATNRYISKIQMVPLETKYPQGGEKQLIKAISGKEVPPGGLPLDIGFLVQNVGTVHAIYEAVHFDKPLIERIVTVSGDCMYRPGNFLVKIGTTIREICENFGIEIYKEPRKIITGGPMMGFSQPSMDTPVLKGTSGILLLSKEKALDFEESQCIRCAKCVDVCPVNLVPTDIMKNVKQGDWETVDQSHASDCMECGSCAYICPARIPLVQYIKEGKMNLRKR